MVPFFPCQGLEICQVVRERHKKFLYSDSGPEVVKDTALLRKAKAFTSSSTYSVIEFMVVLMLLSAIDGGFSGDWSRYNLISKETEVGIQTAVTYTGLFHLFCGTTAGVISSRRKQPALPAVLHCLLIGGPGLFKVLLQSAETAVRFPSMSIYSLKQFLADIAAGEYDATAVNRQIDDLIETNPCVMFSFTSCPYCIKAKSVLIDELGANVKVIELDIDLAVGYPIRAELGRRTGRTSVPSVWIGGQFVGGCSDGATFISTSADSVTFSSTPSSSRPRTALAAGSTTIGDVEGTSGGGVLGLNRSGALRVLLKRAKAI